MSTENYTNLFRRSYRLIHLGVLVWLLTIWSCGTSSIQLDSLDLVLQGGRVMDPETGLDAVRNVGILDGKIITVTE